MIEYNQGSVGYVSSVVSCFNFAQKLKNNAFQGRCLRAETVKKTRNSRKIRTFYGVNMKSSDHNQDRKYDADVIVIGSGVGGLVTATQLAKHGAKVIVLEQYLIPGGSGGAFTRNGYTFDVGASMIFGLGDHDGSTNLLTRALTDIGQSIESIPDPVQIHYHLPNELSLRVHREFEEYLNELSLLFPKERDAIRSFYNECWTVFNSLNAMPLYSLEEPRYLLSVFLQNPIGCLQLLRYFPQNVGDVVNKYISDPILKKYIDLDCFLWSVVNAEKTPMINAGMVFCDRHFGGIRYPKGGVGQISERLVDGLKSYEGCSIQYKSRVKRILYDSETNQAFGVELTNGNTLYAKTIVSNATRWDTFDKLMDDSYVLPESEQKWRDRYMKSPSFLSLHLAVDESVFDSSIKHQDDCHHIILEDWDQMEACNDANGTIFMSIPTVLDPSLAPKGKHIFHVFTPSDIEEWNELNTKEYEQQKIDFTNKLLSRIEQSKVFPNLSKCIEFQLIGTPRTHRRFLSRIDGTYGPIPSSTQRGLIRMPFNQTSVNQLYCVGDSAFPGQGLNAVAFSGFACAYRIAVDLNLKPSLPLVGNALTNVLSKTRLTLFSN